MSEHITHIAVYDDTVRLIQYSDRFTGAFKESTSKEYDTGLVTSGTNGNHIWAVPLLEEYRIKYKAGDRSRETLKKISAAIGWITHRASDLVQKPVEAIVDFEAHPIYNGQEQSAYFDTISFKEVFKGGKISVTDLEPISPASLEDDMKSHPASHGINIGDLEIPVSHFYLSEILKLHEFTGAQMDFDSWFDLFMACKQKFSEDLKFYCDSYNNPDPARIGKYITNLNYYNNNDQIIRLLRSIQKNNPDISIPVEVAIDASNCQSLYSKMIRNSYTMLIYASDFFDGKVEKASLYDVLNMNASERI